MAARRPKMSHNRPWSGVKAALPRRKPPGVNQGSELDLMALSQFRVNVSNTTYPQAMMPGVLWRTRSLMRARRVSVARLGHAWQARNATRCSPISN